MIYYSIIPYTHILKRDKELTSFHNDINDYVERLKWLITNYKNLMGVHIKHLNNETYETHDFYVGIDDLKKSVVYQEKLAKMGYDII